MGDPYLKSTAIATSLQILDIKSHTHTHTHRMQCCSLHDGSATPDVDRSRGPAALGRAQPFKGLLPGTEHHRGDGCDLPFSWRTKPTASTLCVCVCVCVFCVCMCVCGFCECFCVCVCACVYVSLTFSKFPPPRSIVFLVDC